MQMYGGPLENMQHLYFYGKSLVDAHLLGSMKEDEECDYYCTWIDDSSPQGGDKDIYSVGEDNSNMCKDVVKEMELT